MPLYRAGQPPEVKPNPLLVTLYKLMHDSATYEAFLEALSKLEFTPKQNERVGEFLEAALVHYPPTTEPDLVLPGPL
jgi:hypothetical protein